MGQAESKRTHSKRKARSMSPQPLAKRTRTAARPQLRNGGVSTAAVPHGAGDGAESSAAPLKRAAAAAAAAASAAAAALASVASGSRRAALRRDLAGPATRGTPLAPPPVPLYASAADCIVGKFGNDYVIKDAGGSKLLGRALFAARPLAAGELIARFSGEILHSESIPQWRSSSHMLRLPGSDLVVDGRKLAKALVRVPGKPLASWKPSGKGKWGNPALGFACMANSAPKQVATATVRFICDDTGPGVRPAGFVPTAEGCPRLNAEAERVLPRAAYLVARRNMRAGEEITWHYQVALR